MGENYELIKYLWQNLFVENLQDNPLAFDGASNKDLLLPRLIELPSLPTSFLEIGPWYNPWVKSMIGKREIHRVHLSDPIYKTRGMPRPENIGINPEILSADKFGLPELLDLLPDLGLGETTLVFANILNYVDGGDVASLLAEVSGIYSPQVVVIGNNFNATLGHGYVNRIKSPEILKELLVSRKFQQVFEEFDDEILAGIYQREK